MDQKDRQFCWDQVLRIHPLFRVTHPFIPRKYSDSTLGLYALISALEEAVCSYTDESIPRAKLAWWRQELLGPQSSHSQHPIVKQLNQNRSNWWQFEENIVGLLDVTVERLEGNLPADVDSLKDLCERIGRYPMMLELGLAGDVGFELSELTVISTLNGLVQLMRESSRGQETAYWWVPLSLLARHQVTCSELRALRKSDHGKALYIELHTLYREWCDSDRSRSAHGATSRKPNKTQRHWQIHTAFHLRQLRESSAMYPQSIHKLFTQVRIGDVWFAWRNARIDELRNTIS
jgi:phytoene/squalene synthetase